MKILIYLIFLFSITIFAQDKNVYVDAPKKKSCGFIKANPKLTKEKIAKFNSWIEQQSYKSSSKNKRLANEITILKVVVHVIHDGDAVGSNENISDARVRSQIIVLNQDFRREQGTPGFNNNPVGVDTKIKSELADTKPDRTPTNGINRVNYGVSQFFSTPQIDQMKAQTIWDPTKYVNIWVVNFNEKYDNDNPVYGFAKFPSESTLTGISKEDESTAENDGVVIDWKAFGSRSLVSGTYYTDFDKGRTTTHELGHYLGLLHVFDDNSNGDCSDNRVGVCLDNDFCNDTPVQKCPSTICDTNKDSCPDEPGKDMVQNYMDYTDDACMNIFTQDQFRRMDIVLNNAVRRKSLRDSLKVDESPFLKERNLLVKPIYNSSSNDVEYLLIEQKNPTQITVQIYTNSGALVYNQKHQDKKIQIPTQNFNSGIYIVYVNSSFGTDKHKFIKK